MGKPGQVIRMRPWRAGDEAAFKPRDDMAEDGRVLPWDWAADQPTRTWTLTRGDEVIGVGGVNEIAAGEYDAWACLAPVRKRDWPRLHWLAMRVIAFAETELAASVIHAFTRAGCGGGMRSLQRLGFSPGATVQAQTAEGARLVYVTMTRRV